MFNRRCIGLGGRDSTCHGLRHRVRIKRWMLLVDAGQMKIPTNRILAQCTIDPMGDGKFVAIVSGLEDHAGFKRIYTMIAPDEDKAARDALQRFEDELS